MAVEADAGRRGDSAAAVPTPASRRARPMMMMAGGRRTPRGSSGLEATSSDPPPGLDHRRRSAWTFVGERVPRRRGAVFASICALGAHAPRHVPSDNRTTAQACILVVEDDPVVGTLVSRLLDSVGEVVLARTGEEA